MKLKLHKRVNRSLFGDVGILVFLLAFGIFMSLPLVYAINNAFKPFDELFMFPPKFFVRNPTGENFSDLFTIMSSSWVPFSRYLFNTVFVTLIGTVGHILLSSMSAYALAKFVFPGGKLCFSIIVLSLMFSSQVTSIPNYLVMSRLNWVDTHWSLIIPALGSSLGLYLMKQFMEQLIPDALLEAARIDGSGEFRIFFEIVMPLVKPAWITLAILSIQNLWGATGSVYIYSEKLKTLPTALNQIVSSGVGRSGVAAAVTVIIMIVPIFTFLFSQSRILETMATSGMKE